MKRYNLYNSLYLLGTISIFFLLSIATCFAHSWMAPENEAKRKNPIIQSDESLNIGSELFEELCSSCHGHKGIGSKKQVTGLSKDTPNLPIRLSTHSDGDFHWKILEGKGDMPSFENEVSEKEVWHIINYLKTLEKQ